MSDPAALTCPHGHSSTDPGYCTVCGTTMAGPLPPPDSAPTTTFSHVTPFSPRADFATLSTMSCPHCSAPLDESSRFCEVCGYDPETGSLPEAPAVVPAPDEPSPYPPAPASPFGSGPSSPSSSSLSSSPLSSASAPASSSPPGGYPSPPGGPPLRPQAAGPWASAPVAPGAAGSGTPSAPVIVAVITADRPYYESHYVSEVAFPLGAPARTIELPPGPIHIGRRSRSRGTDPAIDLAGPPEDSAVSHTHASLLPRPDGSWELVDHGSTNGTYVNESPEPLPANQPRRVGPGDRIYVGAWTRITLEPAPYR